MAEQEQVLVVDRSAVNEVGEFQGVCFDVERYFQRLFAPDVPRFIPRPEAEQDPSRKQIIPYVLLECDGRILNYVRGKRAGETRLVGHRSIGIGGHINPQDDMPLFSDLREAYFTAVQREVDEEVQVDARVVGHKIVGLINDDSTEVGQVHLGVIHLWTLDRPEVARKEQMITQLAFLNRDELSEARDSMETWSQLCLDNLDRLKASEHAVTVA